MYFTVSLYILSILETTRCYTYQTKPLFLSYSDLAALEANSLDHTSRPHSLHGDRKVRAVVVKCHKDSMEVVMKADPFNPRLPVEPKHLRLGPDGAAGHDHCTARASGNGEFIIRARLADCGSQVMFTQDALLYSNVLLYSPPPASPGVMFQAEGAAVPVQCEYKRRYAVSSMALKPTWSPLISVQSKHLNLDFHLRLMTNDWSRERKSSVYSLGETVNIEASVDHHHPPLRLFVDSCVATLTSDVNSYPRYPFIDHQGCFADSQLHGSRSRFLPRVQDKLLQIQLEPFLFHQDHRHTIYITCRLEAEPISNKSPVKKACSFLSGRWRSADGDDRVCESCSRVTETSSTAEFSHRRATRSKAKHRQTELHRDVSLGPVVFLTTVGKHKYKY
ncbi:zona pellucida sperm-binding protein 3-like [Pempheris klunzingeri]|uniref:zona pellucida sperm-binding protein 3-like n=1 Tax=Pempheris klunzingeri TaxID=3127111 RepID=UPI00397FC7C7